MKHCQFIWVQRKLTLSFPYIPQSNLSPLSSVAHNDFHIKGLNKHYLEDLQIAPSFIYGYVMC